MPVALQFPREFKKSAMSDVGDQHAAAAAKGESEAAEDSEELVGAETICVRELSGSKVDFGKNWDCRWRT